MILYCSWVASLPTPHNAHVCSCVFVCMHVCERVRFLARVRVCVRSACVPVAISNNTCHTNAVLLTRIILLSYSRFKIIYCLNMLNKVKHSENNAYNQTKATDPGKKEAPAFLASEFSNM